MTPKFIFTFVLITLMLISCKDLSKFEGQWVYASSEYIPLEIIVIQKNGKNFLIHIENRSNKWKYIGKYDEGSLIFEKFKIDFIEGRSTLLFNHKEYYKINLANIYWDDPESYQEMAAEQAMMSFEDVQINEVEQIKIDSTFERDITEFNDMKALIKEAMSR